MIPCLTSLLLCFGSVNAVELSDSDVSVKVNNGLVPTNSNYTDQMSAVIAFSTDEQSIANGMTGMLNIHPDTVGAIIVSAPFCDSYPGFKCLAEVPRHCLQKVHRSGALLISGVITPYGLDMNSLRCFFLADPNSVEVPQRRGHCFHH